MLLNWAQIEGLLSEEKQRSLRVSETEKKQKKKTEREESVAFQHRSSLFRQSSL